MQTILMTPQEWSGVSDNPKQRDTEARARKALKAHLKQAAAPHANVAAAILTDGTMYKLDGHTRCYLWSSGELDAPAHVRVDVYPATSVVEVMQLYDMFDNPSAVESASDRVSGAFRYHKIKPVSSLLKYGGITSALGVIEGKAKIDAVEAVGKWREELILLDEAMLNKERMPSALIAAALVGVSLHGVETLEFWKLFCADEGKRSGGASDGVDALSRLIGRRRAEKTLSNQNHAFDVAGKCYSALKGWMDGRLFTSGIKGHDFSVLTAKARAQKTINQT